MGLEIAVSHTKQTPATQFNRQQFAISKITHPSTFSHHNQPPAPRTANLPRRQAGSQPPASLAVRRVTNYSLSNRHSARLENAISRRKQTTASRSNRHKSAFSAARIGSQNEGRAAHPSTPGKQPPLSFAGAASLCAVCKGCVAKRQALFPRAPGSLRTSSALAIQYGAPILYASDGLRLRTLACPPLSGGPTAFGRHPARVRHQQLPTQRQTQKPINFTVNCRSGSSIPVTRQEGKHES